jgi:nucleotide-binding universal stress UspA family protein
VPYRAPESLTTCSLHYVAIERKVLLFTVLFPFGHYTVDIRNEPGGQDDSVHAATLRAKVIQCRDRGDRRNEFREADMYKRILVAIDGSETAEHAFDSALQLAHDNDAQLQPLYVVDNPLMAYDASGYDPTILRDACVEEGQRLMADALARMKHENVAGVPRIVDVAPIGEDISERIRVSANEFNADLLVLGTHGRRGFKRLFLGSVAERVVRSASLPVLLVPSRQAQTEVAEDAKRRHADIAAATYELPPQ